MSFHEAHQLLFGGFDVGQRHLSQSFPTAVNNDVI